MTDTIYVYDDYKILADQALDFSNQSGFYFSSNDDASLTNRGSVYVHGAGDLWSHRLAGAFTNGSAFYFDSVIHNRASGEFVVHAVGEGMEAFGYLGVGWGPAFQNDGRFVVESENDSAWGVSTNSSNDSFVNNGSFEVTAFKSAVGVSLGNGGTYLNTGLIAVTGGEAAVGVALGSYDSLFDNTGDVIAAAGPDGAASIGVSLYNGFHRVENAGTITADIAIKGYAGPTRIFNSGTMTGDVELGSERDMVWNSGLVRGSVDLGMGNDRLDGTGGKVTQVVYGGLGNDVLIGGAKSDVMHGDTGVSDGQDGRDRLLGGDGADRLFGDGGKDLLVGGLGTDILSGGLLADVFRYQDVEESTQAAADRILDLGVRDVIHLALIDADLSQDGDQAFTLVNEFSGQAGELRLTYDAASGVTSIEAQVDADGSIDMLILVDGDHSGFVNFAL